MLLNSNPPVRHHRRHHNHHRHHIGQVLQFEAFQAGQVLLLQAGVQVGQVLPLQADRQVLPVPVPTLLRTSSHILTGLPTERAPLLSIEK